MWTVGSKSTIKIDCDVKRNFPLSIEMQFGGMPKAQSSWGMWLSVSDAQYLARGLKAAIAKQKSAQHCVQLTRLRLWWAVAILKIRRATNACR